MDYLKVTLLVIIGYFAAAPEVRADADFAYECRKPNLTANNVCYQYVRGFLEGAVLTDYATLKGIEENKGFTSDFSKRAFSTRVGRNHAGTPSTYFAKFCLPGDRVNSETVISVIKKIVRRHSNASFSKQVYQATQATYPCEHQ
ncbi:hypothetical protein [Paraferrimonas haliotis]|uniref:Rap1a immunity protein domain-containing protein n=1 Tax=Paraferrimonas haliotis TaxID=2013866 RepID=A0AA37WWN7_9GAMM|nr:hypothetical protein [Paraferrimonas haliotis]GLS83703.1 hypothetical protein GCM10007894_16800 [Paraferrimonas haliotis]